ncbi:DUF1223 domain-containing protein [Chitinophaga sp.]|uniref:DUF1223 domain-containing protein n=1 Tax=Chitinophaga sp. TaxID=1869181 RepID=UPI0031E45DA2
MKKIYLLAAMTLLSFKASSQGFIVLELFTSEGCSSCPPAEELLASIQTDKPVYILEYHVDYWDRLGWKDPFSSHQFSERQYQYSRFLSSQVYTPQLVMNGTSECVGSDAAIVNKTINAALSKPAKTTLNVQGTIRGGKLTVNQKNILIAIVQKHAVSQVKRGENEGRTLSHIQIVRSLRLVKGKEAIDLPDGFNLQDYEIIAMVQNPSTGEITAVSRITPTL